MYRVEVMSIEIFLLLVIAAWTLLLVLSALEAYRWRRILKRFVHRRFPGRRNFRWRYQSSLESRTSQRGRATPAVRDAGKC